MKTSMIHIFVAFMPLIICFFLPSVYTCDDAQRSNSDIVKEKLFSPSVLYLTIYKLGITNPTPLKNNLVLEI
jgi:hypothetical protein